MPYGRRPVAYAKTFAVRGRVQAQLPLSLLRRLQRMRQGGRGAALDAPEKRPYPLLDGGTVEVADDGQHRVGGLVMLPVKRNHILMLQGLDIALDADGVVAIRMHLERREGKGVEEH